MDSSLRCCLNVGLLDEDAVSEIPNNPSEVKPNKNMVLVLDDDSSIRESLGFLLSAKGYAVQSHATPESLLSETMPDVPSCLILDHELGNGVTGVQVYEEMRDLGWIIPTIFLTAHWNVQSIVDAMRAGADDFITKPFDPETLIKAVSLALKRDATRRKTDGEIYKIHSRAAKLTGRERDIVSMVVGGLLNKEVAAHLNLALITVKVHRSNAMRKLGAGNAADLARIATLAGIKHFKGGASGQHG